MADRDIPSIPITTLAGLASVSDCKFSHNLSLIDKYEYMEIIFIYIV